MVALTWNNWWTLNMHTRCSTEREHMPNADVTLHSFIEIHRNDYTFGDWKWILHSDKLHWLIAISHNVMHSNIDRLSIIYLCWRKLSGRLKCLPHTSHEKAISGLLCVRSWIIRLYDFVNRLWQYLHTYSHFGRILRRKSSLSIFKTVNMFETTLLFCS